MPKRAVATLSLPAFVFFALLVILAKQSGAYPINSVNNNAMSSPLPPNMSKTNRDDAGNIQQHNNKRPRFTSPNRPSAGLALASSSSEDTNSVVGRLEKLKQQEALLAKQLVAVQREKRKALQESRPLRIGVIGFGRFGQFIARAFANHGHQVVVTSRSDYTEIANAMGVQYVPLNQPEAFFFSTPPRTTASSAAENDATDTNGENRRKDNNNTLLDIVVFCVSIVSFEETARSMLPYIQRDVDQRRLQCQAEQRQENESSLGEDNVMIKGPMVVDVLSVKEHPRQILLDLMPPEVDLLLTHPMFGPDSGKDSWKGLTFVYEKTRIAGTLYEQEDDRNDDEYPIQAVDRMERFLSIWEEEGCNMVKMSCRDHDAYAANSQFITHLMGRILGEQKGLQPTPIDTSGFKNVLNLIDRTTADSFELFYGLFKFNQNSHATILNLRAAMDDVVARLYTKEREEAAEHAILSNPVHHLENAQHQNPSSERHRSS